MERGGVNHAIAQQFLVRGLTVGPLSCVLSSVPRSL